MVCAVHLFSSRHCRGKYLGNCCFFSQFDDDVWEKATENVGYAENLLSGRCYLSDILWE